MKIEQKFHDYCEGCPFLDALHCKDGARVASGTMELLHSFITCKDYERCARLWARMAVIRNEPPDLMEQIAAVCREKGISVDEAVELFRKF